LLGFEPNKATFRTFQISFSELWWKQNKQLDSKKKKKKREFHYFIFITTLRNLFEKFWKLLYWVQNQAINKTYTFFYLLDRWNFCDIVHFCYVKRDIFANFLVSFHSHFGNVQNKCATFRWRADSEIHVKTRQRHSAVRSEKR